MSHMIYPTTNFRATEQMVVAKGEGVYVLDSSGKRYLEGMAGLWCTALGYGNEEVIDCATQQMRDLTFSHMFGGKTHPTAMRLSEQLADMVPITDARIFLGSSGSDANDTQIKLLRYYFNAIGKPQKTKIIARDKGYHGVTVAAASLTGLAANHTHFSLPFSALGVLRTGSPHFYREGHPGETEDEFVDRRMAEIETLILDEGPETIAAFIAEPVNGAGGVIIPPQNYFQKLQQILDKYDILLWDDEVICGFGRLGYDFGASAFEMRPKLMSLAKALSSAYIPISAAVIPGEMYDALVDPVSKVGVFGHGYTYSGHPVACAVASKVLEIYQRDQLFDKAASTGAYLQSQISALANHDLVGEVRGMGLIAGIELVANKTAKTAFDGNTVAAFCQRQCEEQGLILRALGGNTIAICPPLIITVEQIDELVSKLGHALDRTLEFARNERLLKH
ncbi:MAG: aspartate aminotransferase family protein [Congregibacter sp.]